MGTDGQPPDSAVGTRDGRYWDLHHRARRRANLVAEVEAQEAPGQLEDGVVGDPSRP